VQRTRPFRGLASGSPALAVARGVFIRDNPGPPLQPEEIARPAREASKQKVHEARRAEACSFCERLTARELTAENQLAAAFPDVFPLTLGHTLIVPRRHVADLFDLDAAEQAAMWDLLVPVKRALDEMHHPDGYNLGLNNGAVAGQTIVHIHVHVIPRYRGDVADPLGGIRHMFPDRGRYWEER
jgi:diadenosine tetraphosphate (Ap4A) HIT family hydrolase